MSTLIPPPPPGGERPPLPPCPIPPPSALLTAPLLHTLPLPEPQPLPREGRDANGRFAPGNPGKQPGTRHRVSIAMENLMEGQWEGLTKTAIALALRGDVTALRLCFDRLVPVRRGSSVQIPDFPKVESVADVPKAQAAILAAVAAGHLTADEATPLSNLLAVYIGVIDATTFAERLAELEKHVDEVKRKGRRGP